MGSDDNYNNGSVNKEGGDEDYNVSNFKYFFCFYKRFYDKIIF